MASAYDKASLVMLPNAYKDGKVYSVKPEDRSGDFTFTRSTAATRVNADGNIEKETQNLLTQSNNFSSTDWTRASGCAMVGKNATDPFGVENNAWSVSYNGTTNGRFEQLYNTTTGNVYTSSIYARATSGTPTIFIGDSSGTKSFVLSTNWTRVEHFKVANDTTFYLKFQCDTAETIEFYGAQLNQGLIAQELITTTTSAVYGGITDNVPRLDYTDSSCPALLLEPLRTNLVPQSEYFESSSWGQYVFGGASLTRTFGYQSPEGNNNAYKFDVVVGTGGVLLTDNITINPANAQTLSVWMKGENGGEKVILALRNSSSGGEGTSVITLTNEWAIYDVTLTPAAANRGFQFRMLSSNGIVDQTIYVYGAQLEEGSYPSSYIPTYGSSVSRVAENCAKTGISDLIGQTEGTLFFEGKADDYTNPVSIINTNRTTQFTLVIVKKADGTILGQVFNNGSSIIEILTPSLVSGTFKLALAYKSGDTSFYVNGTQIGTSSVAFTPSASLNELYIGSFGGPYFAYDHPVDCNQALLFKTRLSNSELAALTTI